MTLDDLKENITSRLKTISERIKESDYYHRLSDRFENMKASQQQLTLVGLVSALVILLLVTPLSSLLSSNSSLGEFEVQRELIRDLIKVQREMRELPNLPESPNGDSLRALAEAKIKQSNLLPEQVKGIEISPTSSRLISPNHLHAGLTVRLSKLNVRQIVDIGARLQDINPSVKMLDLIIDPNASDSRYSDVTYRLASLNIPRPPPPPLPEAPEKNTRKKNKKSESEE